MADQRDTDALHDDELRQRLAAESGSIAWSDLVRHFARGVVIKVGPSLTLEETALCVVSDEVQQIQAWLDAGELARASDDDARDWTTRSPSFQCVVTAPWVLVKEISQES